MNLRNICPKDDFDVFVKIDVLRFQITETIIIISVTKSWGLDIFSPQQI